MPKTTTARRSARTANAQPPAPTETNAAAATPVQPGKRAPVLTDEQRAALSTFTPEEHAQMAADRAAEAAVLAGLDHKINGNGFFEIGDASEPLGDTSPVGAISANGASSVLAQIAASAANLTDAEIIAQVRALQQQSAPIAESGAPAAPAVPVVAHNGANVLDAHDPLVPGTTPEKFSQPKPEALWESTRRPNRTPDQPMPIDETNPVAQILGARVWNAKHSFDWCREVLTGGRHFFTYFFPEQRALVDVYAPDVYRTNERAVLREVAEKAQQIEMHNATDDRMPPLGYMAFVAGYEPKPGELEDVKRGFVCDTLRTQYVREPIPPDRYDSARAATGDPMAGATAPGAAPINAWNMSAAERAVR